MSVWLKALRLFSLPASAMPVLLAGAYAMFQQQTTDITIKWQYFLPALIGGIAYHLGGNLISDYFDWKKGVDQSDTLGSSRVLVDGELFPKNILAVGYALMTLGSMIGLGLAWYVGVNLLWFGLAGFLGGIFYYQLKYNALGDLIVFLLFGPLMVTGTYYVLTDRLPVSVWLLSIPIALLTTAILHANNMRDIKHDQRAGIKTTPMIVGIKSAKISYYVENIGAYVAVLFMVVFQLLPLWTLLVFITLPMAINNMKYIALANIEKPEQIKSGDALTAKQQMIFSILLIAGLLIVSWE